ncbi:hypothetical protein [Paenimyroides aestuarii]|uniref:STAS domain-containing protein n=1 Tax=Paenimyroides aestuarii TaxID=2968490 RepID=A0ABY5NQ75_9FLAO|nr:hypothetical protein [Paenimyroides aestuarii]UUV20666.1 hypothetical protein NPX36_09985 [Paenimyroides aestuarii]
MKNLSKSYKRYHRISKAERKRRNKARIIRIHPFTNFKDFYVDYIKRRKKTVILKPDNNFELLIYPKEVINFIANLKSLKNNDDISEILIDLDDVQNIDIGAISLLLSSVEELTLNNKLVSGSVPKNKNAYNFLLESGFFQNISKVNKRLTNNIKTRKNENKNLLLLGYSTTKGKGKIVGENIKLAMEALTGTKQHYRPIYTLIMEMNANSIEHAYYKGKDEKHWVLGINYKKNENKLYFTFTDNGLGILQQLNIRLDRRIKQLLKDRKFSNDLMLKNLFDKKYNSRFKTQNNRNRGLPIIQHQSVKNTVKNLICITNDVYLNLETKNSIILDREFSGTFYYWELDLILLQKDGEHFN